VGNNRIFYSCLGVALASPNSFTTSILEGVQSVGVTSSKDIEYFLPSASKISTGFFSSVPDISFNYSQILHSFEDLDDIDGVNDYVDLYMFVGDENVSCLDASRYIICRYLLLESIEYNLSVDNFFTLTKNFKGFSRYICSTTQNPTIPRCSDPNPTNTDLVGRRQNFHVSGSSLPSVLTTSNALQNISIKSTINRKQISETGTKTPYGSAINFPIETTISFGLISQNLDNYNDTFSTVSCSGLMNELTNINIAICGQGDIIDGSLSINDAFLSNVNYNGGDTGGGNQSITIDYVSYDSTGIEPLIEFPSNAATGCS
jgi:hypothetical protein